MYGGDQRSAGGAGGVARPRSWAQTKVVGAAVQVGYVAAVLVSSSVQAQSPRLDVIRAMMQRPDDVWPRGKGHVVLALPGSPETAKGYHEPGGGFSPVFGSFGVGDLFGKGGRDTIDQPWTSAEQRLMAPTGQFSSNVGVTREKGQAYHDYMVGRLVEFLVLFTVYFVARAHFPEAFAQGAERLSTVSGTLITLIMVTSSYFIACSVATMRAGARYPTAVDTRTRPSLFMGCGPTPHAPGSLASGHAGQPSSSAAASSKRAALIVWTPSPRS